MPDGARPVYLPLPERGQVAEWLKAHAWKVCNGESRSRVRIPLCPPYPRSHLQSIDRWRPLPFAAIRELLWTEVYAVFYTVQKKPKIPGLYAGGGLYLPVATGRTKNWVVR